jgi:hypothetical protein
MPFGSSLRATRPWSIAVVMAIIAAGLMGVWYWGSIVKQRLPDWTWSKAGASLTPNRATKSEMQEERFWLRFDAKAVNKGSAPADAISVGEFVSLDNKLSADDDAGGAWYDDILDPGQEWSYQVAMAVNVVPILKGKPPGVYYVILVLDHLHKIAETNEGNNAIALKFEICPGTQC